MLPTLFLLFGGIAIASALFDDDQFDTRDEGDEEPVDEGVEFINFDQVDAFHEFDLTLTNNSEVNEETLHDEESVGVQLSEIVDPNTDIGTGTLSSNFELNTAVQLSSEQLTSLPPALSDWTEHTNVLVEEMGENQTLHLNISENQPGSLVVVEASYVELGNTDSGITETEHYGLNIYFVPEGDTFPEQYDWSTSGATLVDTLDYQNSAADWGGIKLLARIDSGSTTIEQTDQQESVLINDDRMGEPKILSNLQIRYI